MKRMVKNGDLLDVEPDGTITVAGKPVGGGSDLIETEGNTVTVGGNLAVDGNITTSKITPSGTLIIDNPLNLNGNLSWVNNARGNTITGCGAIMLKSSSVTIQPATEIDANTIKFYSFSSFPKFALGTQNKNYVISVNSDNPISSGQKGSFDLRSANKDAIFSGFRSRIPEPPTEAGTYRLVATVSSAGELTFNWVSN